MIKSIEIENFRGIQHGKLAGLTPLTILVGPNGCGKSTILDAILLGTRTVPSAAVQHIREQRLHVEHGARWLLYRTSQSRASTIGITTTALEHRTVTIHPELPTTDRLNMLFSVQQQLPSRSTQTSPQQIASIGNTNWNYDPTPFPLEGISDAVLIDIGATGQNSLLHQLFSTTVIEGRRDEVNDSIRAVLPGVDHIEILTEGNVPVMHLVYYNYSVPAALSGDGIHDLLRLCLELASRPNGIVLMEEPEVHQHPGALRQSALAILAAVRRGIQVVLSTHSLDLIDYLLTETVAETELNNISVRGLKLQDGCLKSSNLSGSDAAFARSQIQDDLR